jgi:hypothetical protein
MFFQRYANLVLCFILSVSAALSIGAMRDDTATFDERAHIPAAYSYVRFGDMRLNPEHPPLLKDLAGLPLLFLDLHFPLQSDLWTNGITQEHRFGTAMWSTWDIGTEFLYRSGNDAESILFWSRLPMVLLSTLLGWFVYRSAKELAGTLAGLFAALLFAFDPNILAHNHLVTTDLGIAAFLFMAISCFIRFLKNPSPRTLVLAGLTLGLAQLSKFSAIILIPLFGIFAVLAGFTHASSATNDDKTSPFTSITMLLSKYILVLVIAFMTIFAGYYGNTLHMPTDKTLLHADLVFAGNELPKTFARNTIHALVDIPGMAPLAHYALGVFMVFSRVTGGNTFYFLGHVFEPSLGEGTKAYFPILFALKETLPFVFLASGALVIGFLGLFKKPSPSPRFATAFRQHIAIVVMTSFVAFYVLLSITGNLNIGFRHLFPILPFVHVLASVALFRFIARHSSSHTDHMYCPTRHLARLLVGGIAFWIFMIPFFVYPNFLSYYNEIVGAKNGHRIAVDSNYDWGQNLKRLKFWMDDYNAAHDVTIATINIDYYGGSDVRTYFPEGSFAFWHADDAPKPGWFAISATTFEESIRKPMQNGRGNYRWLLSYEPVGRAGDSIVIFYVSPERFRSLEDSKE